MKKVLTIRSVERSSLGGGVAIRAVQAPADMDKPGRPSAPWRRRPESRKVLENLYKVVGRNASEAGQEGQGAQLLKVRRRDGGLQPRQGQGAEAALREPRAVHRRDDRLPRLLPTRQTLFKVIEADQRHVSSACQQ